MLRKLMRSLSRLLGNRSETRLPRRILAVECLETVAAIRGSRDHRAQFHNRQYCRQRERNSNWQRCIPDRGPALRPSGSGRRRPGDLFIADEKDSRVWEVIHSSGLITTVAGNGTAGYSGDGGRPPPPSSNQPTGVAVYTKASSRFSFPSPTM